jgi:hypothetical protein
MFVTQKLSIFPAQYKVRQMPLARRPIRTLKSKTQSLYAMTKNKPQPCGGTCRPPQSTAQAKHEAEHVSEMVPPAIKLPSSGSTEPTPFADSMTSLQAARLPNATPSAINRSLERPFFSLEQLQKVVELWDWSAEPSAQTSKTIDVTEALLTGTLPAKYVTTRESRNMFIYDYIVEGLIVEFSRHGYGPFSLGRIPGKMICYYEPGARLRPLEEWHKFDFIVVEGPFDAGFVPDVSDGPWEPMPAPPGGS